MIIPEADVNIISVIKLTKLGIEVRFIGNKVIFLIGKKIIGEGHCKDDKHFIINEATREKIKEIESEEDIYFDTWEEIFGKSKVIKSMTEEQKEELRRRVLENLRVPDINERRVVMDNEKAFEFISESNENPLLVLHKKFSHACMKNLKDKISKDIIRIDREVRKKIMEMKELPICVSCIAGKMRRSNFRPKSEKFYGVGQKLCIDYKGPFPESIIGRYNGVFVVSDYHSDYVFLYFVKYKDEAKKAVEAAINFFNLNGHEVTVFQNDSDKIFTSKEMNEYLMSRGIVQQNSVPLKHEQNGVVERDIGTLMSLTRTMLIEAGIDIRFWNLALEHAAYTWNRTPRNGKTSAKKVLKRNEGEEKEIKVHNLPIFFQPGLTYAKYEDKNFSMRAIPCFFVGVAEESKRAFKVYVPRTRKIIIRDQVKWLKMAKSKLKDPLIFTRTCILNSEEELDKEEIEYVNKINDQEPKSLKDALSSSEKDEWQEAIIKEKKIFFDHNTFAPVAKNKRKFIEKNLVVPSHLIFKRIMDNDLKIKFKVRLVARGDKQQVNNEDLMYKFYAPTVEPDLVRLFSQIAFNNDYKITIFDVSGAFLESKNDRKQYIKLPKLFASDYYDYGDDFDIVEVTGNLYGLRQAPRLWFEKLEDILIEFGFIKSKFTSNIYHWKKDNEVIFLLVHVDDALVIYKEEKSIENLKIFLETKVKEVRFSKKFKKFLGINYEIENDMQLHQNDYITKKLEVNEGVNNKFITMKINENKNSLVEQENTSREFYARCGKLRFIADRTRMDISAALNEITTGKYSNSIKLLKQLENYIINTANWKVKYKRSNIKLCAFTDAALIKNGDAKSRLGGVFYLNDRSGAFNSFSIKSTTLDSSISTSSCEAEIKGIYEVASLLVLYTRVLREFEVIESIPSIIWSDNLAAIELCKRGDSTVKTRHVNSRLQYIKFWIKCKLIDIKFVEGKNNVADGLTKVLNSKDQLEFTTRLLYGYKSL